jgi:hypothetical protein
MACTCLMRFQENGEGRHQCHWTPDQFDQFQRRLLVPHNRLLQHSVVLSYSLGRSYCHFDFQDNSAAAAVGMAACSALPSLLVSESCLLETGSNRASGAHLFPENSNRAANVVLQQQACPWGSEL